MKIKIITDGTGYGTQVLDAETGKPIERCLKIAFEAAVGEMPIVHFWVYADEVEIIGEGEKQEVVRKIEKVSLPMTAPNIWQKVKEWWKGLK